MNRPIVTLDSLVDLLEHGPPLEADFPDYMKVCAAQLIFLQLLNQETSAQLCLSTSVDRRYASARTYLRMDTVKEDTNQDQIVRGARLFSLAEALYNLQHVDGFERLLKDIENGNVQSAWEELSFAMFFLSRNISFRFVEPSTKPNEKTPDLEISVEGVLLPCEVEGKEEATQPTEKTVYNTLEHARRQLPKDCPGLICLKIPELWKGSPAIPTVFSAINCFFSATERVVAVILRSERHVFSHEDDGLPQSTAVMFLRRNRASRLLTSEVDAALTRIWQPQDKNSVKPLDAVALVMSKLNQGRSNFLRHPGHASYCWLDIRAKFLAELRNSLAKMCPPIFI